MKVAKKVFAEATERAAVLMTDAVLRCAILEWIFVHSQNHVTPTFHATPAEAWGDNTFLMLMTRYGNLLPGYQITATGKSIVLEDTGKKNVFLKVPGFKRGDVMLKLAYQNLLKPTAEDKARLPQAPPSLRKYGASKVEDTAKPVVL